MRISDAKRLLAAIMQQNLEELETNLKKGTPEKAHKNAVIPYFIGDPGVGKTAIPNQVAEEHGIPYYQTIVGQYDAAELGGLTFPNKDGSEAIRLRPDLLPPEYAAGTKDEPLIAIYNLDELAQAFLANQNVCSQIVNEYRVGSHRISSGVTICCTGNKPENKAGTVSMPMHLRDRLMFIPIEADIDDWMVYAVERNLDTRVRAFLRNNPALLHKFQVGVDAYPSPRSWEKVSRIINLGFNDKESRHIRSTAINGQIGEGAKTTFEAWLRVEDRMPNLQEVIAKPDSAPVFGNKDADVLYLLLANLADVTKDSNVEAILRYLSRMPNKEFMAYWVKDVLTRDKTIQKSPHFQKWALKEGQRLLF